MKGLSFGDHRLDKIICTTYAFDSVRISTSFWNPNLEPKNLEPTPFVGYKVHTTKRSEFPVGSSKATIIKKAQEKWRIFGEIA